MADRRIGGDHARVAGHFLIGAKGAEGEPGQRVEPVEGKHRQGDGVRDQIAALVMRQFMRQGEALFLAVIGCIEIGGQHDAAIEDAEGERPLPARCLHHAHAADAQPLARAAQQAVAQIEEGDRLPGKEGEAARKPQPGDDLAHDRRIGGRRDGGHAAVEDVDHLPGIGDRVGRFGPDARHDVGRQDQAQRGDRPQCIGDLRPEGGAHGGADGEDQQHQQRGRDQRLYGPGDHCLSAFSSASISAMSRSVRSSRSARCATSGLTRPPNSRSTRRRDSPAANASRCSLGR